MHQFSVVPECSGATEVETKIGELAHSSGTSVCAAVHAGAAAADLGELVYGRVVHAYSACVGVVLYRPIAVMYMCCSLPTRVCCSLYFCVLRLHTI